MSIHGSYLNFINAEKNKHIVTTVNKIAIPLMILYKRKFRYSIS